MAIVSQMRTYGEKISDETIVSKVLRSLTPKFDHVVAAIEEAKNLSILSVDELMGSLQAHESRINRSSDRNEEKALQVKETANNEGNERENIRLVGRSHGRGGFRNFHGGRHNRDRWRNDEQSNIRKVLQCYHCRRYGNTKADCCYKDQQMNFAAENEKEEEKLFMACIDINPKEGDLWFVDSRCSNHMTDIKSLFQELDDTQRLKVQLGNIKEIQVEEKDTVKVKTNHGKIKLLDNDTKEIIVEVSTDEETRVNSSASPSASTATQNLSNSSSSSSLNSNFSLEEFSDETPPKKYKSLVDIFASCQFALTISNPMSYAELAEKEEWKKAMVEEMKSIEKNGT